MFWVWLLAVPILALMGASRAFGAPWPNQLTHRIGLVVLAFPLLFVVGEPVFSDAADSLRRRRLHPSLLVAVAAATGYASGILAIFAPAPPLAGASALLVSIYLSLRYITSRY